MGNKSFTSYVGMAPRPGTFSIRFSCDALNLQKYAVIYCIFDYFRYSSKLFGMLV